MSDIVERLRDSSCDPSDVCCGLDGCGLFREAADEIEAKDAEIARLREALGEIDNMGCENWPDGHTLTCSCNPCIARHALGEATDE